jgi:hypothetical protein
VGEKREKRERRRGVVRVGEGLGEGSLGLVQGGSDLFSPPMGFNKAWPIIGQVSLTTPTIFLPKIRNWVKRPPNPIPTTPLASE